MKIGTVIQARLGSTRLPGKVLMDICGKPMLQRVIERAKQVKGIDTIVVAVPHGNWELCELATACGVEYMLVYATGKHSENDVLYRYFETANGSDNWGPFDTIMRITGDCPLLDPIIAERVLLMYLLSHKKRGKVFGYVANRKTYPDGYDVEVFSSTALGIANEQATSSSDREHVTPYIYNSGLFNCGELYNDVDLSGYKLSVDTEEDLALVRHVYEKLGENCNLKDVINLLTPKL